MPFGYYNRLTSRQKHIYRLSDSVEVIRLPTDHGLQKFLTALTDALREEDRRQVAEICGELSHEICTQLKAPPVHVKVLAKRPSNDYEELHGLYDPREDIGIAQITVWMRTAQRKQVVAFRTFLRTLLHEICHHLDYEYLMLEESFHTEGFYKRESNLFKQLVDAD